MKSRDLDQSIAEAESVELFELYIFRAVRGRAIKEY